MKWINIETRDQLDQIITESEKTPVLIFKHSRSCSISATALNRLERNWNAQDVTIPTYFLDLLSYRDLSNEIASHFEVRHESPQAILVRQGKAVSNWSHFDISYKEIKDKVMVPN